MLVGPCNSRVSPTLESRGKVSALYRPHNKCVQFEFQKLFSMLSLADESLLRGDPGNFKIFDCRTRRIPRVPRLLLCRAFGRRGGSRCTAARQSPGAS